MALKFGKKELMILALVGVAAAGWGQVVRPTGDLIVVPKTEEVVSGGVRTFDFRAIGRSLGETVRNSFADGRVLVVRPPRGVSWQDHRRQLLAAGDFSSVEPDTWAEPTALSNDPSLNVQWHLFQTSAPRAWDFSVGASAPILAVVDSGVDLTHPDLAPNLVPGYNTISGLAQASGGDVSDVATNGHGTRVAGVACARGNNGVGVSGVGWNLRLMPIRATNQVTGVTPRSELLEGATWAIENGAKVVSVSYTDVQFADVETLGAWARTQGALLVWSAGNNNTNWSAFDHDNVTVVGGTNQSDQRWVSDSTTGSGFGRGVDCFAPAVQIFTTRRGSPWYGNAPAGVSFAVPQVAATLALMMERFPTLSPTEIERRLLLRCANMGPLGNDINFGYGRLNAGAAVEWPIRKYSLTRITASGIPGATGVRVYTLGDDGSVYCNITRAGLPGLLGVWKNGVWLNTISSDVLRPDSGGGEVTIFDVNAQGHVAGAIWNGSQFFGFVWRPGTSIFAPPNYGFNRTEVYGLNNSGEAVGIAYSAFSFNNGFYMSPSGDFSQPASQAPFNLSGNHKYQAIAEDGTIIGVTGAQPFTFSPSTGILLAEPIGFQYCSILEATEEGAFVANFAGPGNFIPYAYLYDSKRRVSENFGVFRVPFGLNESEEVVGAETDSGATSLEARIFRGYVTGRLVDHLAPLPDDPNNVLPPTVTRLVEASDINNLGQIIVTANSTLGQVGLLANPVDTPGLGVNLGQLGSSPTYIGSIPPVLSVTYTDSNGNPYPNGTVLQDYRGDAGLVNINPPSSVTGSYRVFLRANSTAIPGYDGPAYLSRLYPPLGTPAAPRDSFYLPFSGINVVGSDQPVLEMFPGDVDVSGEIDLTDLDLVIAGYGTVDGDAGWSGSLDMDGSGEIDLTDIDIVIANYGLAGDPEP